VDEAPFEMALRRCYEIGIESDARWMMTLDADVLLQENAVSELLAEAESLPGHYFDIEGLLFDKLTGGYRYVGHRMYRAKYLEAALPQIPQPREVIRPEYTTLLRMAALGYPFTGVPRVFGIHDYEQSFADVYRKAFVHANKHPKRVPDFIQRWKQAAVADDDFRVAIRGLYDGLMFTGTTAIDKRDFTEKAAVALQDLALTEKPRLAPGAGFDLVQSVLAAAGPVPEDKSAIPPGTKKLSRWQGLKLKYTDLGAARFLVYSVGALFSRVGERLKQNARL
jgi:hypothetical protein